MKKKLVQKVVFQTKFPVATIGEDIWTLGTKGETLLTLAVVENSERVSVLMTKELTNYHIRVLFYHSVIPGTNISVHIKFGILLLIINVYNLMFCLFSFLPLPL